MTQDQISAVLNNSRFCGLWSYRPYGELRLYCCTIIVAGETSETEMFKGWTDAVKAAGNLLSKTK